MIILDTNVVSEPLKPRFDPAVEAWLDRQPAETLYLTATSLAELRTGVALMPAGKRKAGLDQALSELLGNIFAGRILAFDEAAAEAYANLVSRASRVGHTLSVGDAQIAAIATTRNFIVATRDTTPFVAARVTVINPWEAGVEQ